MPLSNIDSLLQPVSPDAPCGPDLEYDSAFLELDRLSESKPEQQMGTTIVPAQEPDWKDVGTRATELLGKTKDLRVAIKVARALLYTEGLPGFVSALTLLRGLVEKFWDGVYPKLDPEEGNDPTFRVNTLMGLCDGPMFVDRIRTIPLVSSRSFGRFGLRDMAMASGEIPPPAGTEAPKASAIEGAFNEAPIAELQATAAATRSALESLKAIESFVAEKVGAANGTNFSRLTDVLRSADKTVAAQLVRRGAGAEAAGSAEGAVAGPNGVAAPAPSMTGEINSREDVIRVLDKICGYYERVEPSSPIPILLKRSKRLVSASFLDIVRDIAPNGLAQVETFVGKEPPQGK
jgi:type VI secretion system protein ImpA